MNYLDPGFFFDKYVLEQIIFNLMIGFVTGIVIIIFIGLFLYFRRKDKKNKNNDVNNESKNYNKIERELIPK